MLTEEQERAKRHARKEENLRKAFRGNSTARIESLKGIIRALAVDKQPVDEYVKEIAVSYTHLTLPTIRLV